MTAPASVLEEAQKIISGQRREDYGSPPTSGAWSLAPR